MRLKSNLCNYRKLLQFYFKQNSKHSSKNHFNNEQYNGLLKHPLFNFGII